MNTGSISLTLGTSDRVESHLENWAKWQRSGGRQGAHGGSGTPEYSGSSDFDDMCETTDRANARTLDAWINDLPPMQKYAIHNHYLASVYRVRGLIPSASDMEEGKAALSKKLVRWGIY
jgi:hypothetical protein